MPRSLRAVPASILAMLLFICGVGLVRDVASDPSAWGTISVADTHPSLHSSDSATRVDVRQQRRTVANVAVLSAAPAYRLAVGAMARAAKFELCAKRVDRSIVARGYDATAPPHALS
jgi:hypothetical protein